MICDGSVPNEVTVIIGNGFDIECGLPTDYRSFLKFLTAVDKLLALTTGTKTVKRKLLENVNISQEIKDRLINNNLDDYEYWKPCLDSYWYNHFRDNNTNENWIDFESEISKVISKIEESYILDNGTVLTEDDSIHLRRDSNLSKILKPALSGIDWVDKKGVTFSYYKYAITYKALAKRLVDDLNIFIEGFEKYLLEFVSLVKPDYKASIKELISKLKFCSSNYVLTFNYTDTLEKVLKEEGIKADFCYVHGKAGNVGRNNMVLGIDEHLKPENISKYIPFAPFRKYNQRIFKETDSRYVDWITRMAKQEHLRRHLYIFGHSLGQSDKDILKPFVLTPQMDTYIYYRNLDSFSKKVGNMTAIIDMENMILLNGGTERRMAFLPQQ